MTLRTSDSDVVVGSHGISAFSNICSNDDEVWIVCACPEGAGGLNGRDRDGIRVAIDPQVNVASDLTIVVADVTRMAAIRSGLLLTGRIVQFTNFNLSPALEAIRTQEPRVVAIDALLIQTQQGLSFIKRVESLAMPGCAIRLITHGNGKWTTSAREAQPPSGEAPIGRASATPIHPAVSAPQTGTNTRRAPRFPMLDALNAAVEGGHANLVNISVLGAQLVSEPVLRPGQTVKIALPDANEMLHLTAHVAWSTFQQTKQGTPVYRAGIAFTDAAQETLDDYCRRYGAERPLPSF